MKSDHQSVQNIAVIGAGISGLSISRMLMEAGKKVKIFEKLGAAGGLIKCERVNDNLFHKVGGHVFNSHNKEVLNWFWKNFDIDKEFLKAKRNAKIWLNNQFVGYPIENYLFQLPQELKVPIINDLLEIQKSGDNLKPDNYEDLLLNTFGKSLYDLYFKPYNKKLWNCDLSKVPREWLEGKLPTPDVQSIITSNILKEGEKDMVHSFFYYPKENGSQFIVDRLSEGMEIELNTAIKSIEFINDHLIIDQKDHFDAIVYCGDVRELHKICYFPEAEKELESVKDLKSNATSNMFCETDGTEISWLYIPEENFKAHRIIYTGEFSKSNNRGSKRMTCVVEFSGIQDINSMRDELKKLPGNLKELSYNREQNSYVVQFKDTRKEIENLKKKLKPYNLFLMGRFAEWEYYNMDKAIERAMIVRDELVNL